VNFISGIDWRGLFMPGTPLLEIIVRGTVTYLSLYVLLRVILKRQAGAVSISDLLVVVLIADAAQNAMASDYSSIADGVLLVATIVFWSYTLDWLGYHFPLIERFTMPPPLVLVENGHIIWRNMRKEMITEDELMNQVRKQGLEELAEVKKAFMEGDGQISIISYDNRPSHTQKSLLDKSIK
jgi:uncharacterized membrane protein YcaP (DUF421 family)